MILHKPIKAQSSVKMSPTYAPWMEQQQQQPIDVNNLAMPVLKGTHDYNKARRQGNLTTYNPTTDTHIANSIDEQLSKLGLDKLKTKVIPYEENPSMFTLELPNPRLEKIKRNGGIL